MSEVGAVTLGVAATVFSAAFAGDLLSKEWAVSHADGLVFNSRPSELPLRLLMSLVAIGVAFALGRLARARGLGRQWGMWTGCALLVAGTLANGVSPLLWARGVPDFIGVGGGWVWNLADFEIAVGMSAGIVSVGFSAVVVYAREKVTRWRATARVSAPGI
jgi:Signal peptidase (SPase) II